MKKSVNAFWEEIFDKYKVLKIIENEGVFFISADQIKEFKEPRLMTKFDHSKSRPEIFRANNLSILPVDNGQYVIGSFELYKKLLKTDLEPIKKSIPDFIESIDPENIYSESNALNVAMLSGMLDDLIGEDLYETITGRMRSSAFDFNVNCGDKKRIINVEKPQIEVDGGYESTTKLVMIEAKNNEPDDFIIRQLYYPYRFWKMKITKEIVPIFFTYKNGIYTFYVYRFEEENDYNSIKLVKKISYVLDYAQKLKISLKDIPIIKENQDIPFPQADTFNRVKELIQLVQDNYKTSYQIAEFYGLTPRQGNYYLAAARYLDLIEGYKEYTVSTFGESLANLDFKRKNLELARKILCHQPFYLVMEYYVKYGGFPTQEGIIDFMRDSKVNINNNLTVLKRRASTIKGWIQWIINSGIEVTLGD